ncbi:MAG: DNA polymerase III subunit delta [Hyphomonadaceae bacterium]|nr:DNA polymerase III subunit delta [Hyphomonadaceae bacterium]
MKLSGKAADTFLKSPGSEIWAVLLHCDDEGVSAEAARSLLAAWQASEPAERIVLTEDEIARDPALLFDRLEARSLLGERQILTLQLSNEKLSRYILEALALGEKTPGRFDNRLVLSTGFLKSSSKLRKSFEEARQASAVQLVADTETALAELVTESLKSANIEIDSEALAVFTAGLPGHRRLARAEINKLALYGHDLGRPISTHDVSALVASDIDHALPALIGAALDGQAGPCFRELDRLEQAGTSGIAIFRGLQREVERLLSAQATGVRDANAAMKLRPPVWRDQWPDFRARLGRWPETRLVRLLARIHECETDVKQAGAISTATVRHLLSDVLRAAQMSTGR